MEVSPRALIEVVSLLFSPACREYVTGDLCERYTSRRKFLGEAAATLPLGVWNQICRTSDVRLVVAEGGALAFSFMTGAPRPQRSVHSHWR